LRVALDALGRLSEMHGANSFICQRVSNSRWLGGWADVGARFFVSLGLMPKAFTLTLQVLATKVLFGC
jgi:hypothetical protein